MKKNLILILVILGVLGIAAVVILKPAERTVTSDDPIPVESDGGIGSETPEQARESLYLNPEHGISFMYDASPEGYVLEERNGTGAGEPVKSITLITREDQAQYEGDNIPSEGPIAINILVFTNTAKEWPSVWAENNTAYSNINLAFGEPTETVVGGANAIRYTADGLYANDTVVVAHGSYMYVLNASYVDENSRTRIDFGPLLDSVTFVPEAGA